MLNFKSILKSAIPLIIGLLIGAGLTKNKAVFSILITYIVIMILFRLFAKKVKKVKKSTDKKMAARNEVVKTINSTVELAEEGHERGAKIFDKYYKNYTFYMGIILFITILILLIFKLWIWALLCYFSLHFHIIQNQILRGVKDVHKRSSKRKT